MAASRPLASCGALWVRNDAVTSGLILFLPADPDAPIGWARLDAGVIVDTGDQFEGDATGPVVTAIVPAAVTGIDWISLPDFPQAQRDAAARELIADRLIKGDAPLHIVTGQAEDESGRRPVAWVEEQLIDHHLARLKALGITPEALVPAQLAVAAPEVGFVEARIGSEQILRGACLAFCADDALREALLGGAEPVRLTEQQRDAALIRVADDPPLNLITGRFAPKRSWGVGGKFGRQIALLAAALVGLTLLIPHVQNWQMNRAASRLEAETAASAAALFPGSGDPAGQLKAAIVARRGGGAGFLPTLAAVSGAVSSTANVELTALRFAADGTLETTIRATNDAEAAEVRRKIEAAGFTVETGAETQNQGRSLQSIKVRGS